MRERTIISAYTLALVTFGAIAIILWRHFSNFGEQSRWVHHTQEVMTRLEEVLGQLRDLETGQRGYLIAGEDDFLEPYYSSVDVVRERLDEVGSLTADNASQQKRLQELRPVVEQKLAFAQRTIDLFQRGQRERARAHVAGRKGKELMDDIRRRLAEMGEEEERLLELRMQAAEATGWRATILIIFGNGFAFALLATGTILLGRELNRRKRLEQDVAFREERAGLQMTAERAQRRLQIVVDEMPVGVVVADALSGDVVLENAKMRALSGGSWSSYAAAEAFSQLLRSDGTPYPVGTHPLGRAMRGGEVVKGEEMQLKRLDGPLLTLLANAAPIRDSDGRIVAAVGVFDDYGQQKWNEDQRRESQRFRDLFLSALGHDLRNPLTVITAGAASLARRTRTAEESKVVARMASSAERMARMIGQLLDLTQARLGGGMPIEPERTDLGDIASRVLERLEVLHPEWKIELTVEGDLTGAWDRDRLAQVVENLVTNAFEHGAKHTAVRVRVFSRGSERIVEVHNWGNPIPPPLVPLMFDPFRRAAERTRLKSVGLGLGLYLSLQILHAHDGRIDVESTAEAGTTFRVVLPSKT